MPSAFEHGPAITVPASNTTAKAAVIWSAASNLGESTIILDSGGNGRIGIAGDLDVITITSGTVTVAGTVAATAYTGDGSSLTGISGTTINNNADNRVITGSGTANTLEGEATLTFGSNALSFDNDHDGNNAINLINDSNTSSASTRLTIQTGGASAGDAEALFSAGGDSYIIGVDNSDSNKFKIANTNGNLGTNDRAILTTDGYFDLYKSGGGSTTNGHFRLHHSGTSHGLTTLPQTNHVSSAEAVATDTYFSIQPGWYTANGGSAVIKSFSQGNTGFYLTSWIGTFWTTQASNQGATCQIMMRPHDGSNGDLTINTSANICAMGYYDGSTSSRSFFFRADGTGYADDSWTTFSDNRLKFNQEVVPYGLDTIMQLQPKVYDKYSGSIEDGVVTLSTTSKRQIGFVAQEIKAIIPEIVPFNADENNGWYSLEDGKLMAVVVKAIQELKAEVDALKA